MPWYNWVSWREIIYTDFSRAFDKIDHGLSLKKVACFSLNDSFILFLKSYLTMRYNYVYYNGYKSLDYCSTSGSKLGPLLFVLFVNDLLEMFTCSALAYADDLKLYSRITDSSDVALLQINLNWLSRWCCENNLPLNVDMCFFLSFTRKTMYHNSFYTMGDHYLSRRQKFLVLILFTI